MMAGNKYQIAYISKDAEQTKNFLDRFREIYVVFVFDNGFKLFDWLNKGNYVNAIVSTGRVNSPSGIVLLQMLKASGKFQATPFVFILDRIDHSIRKDLLNNKVSEIFDHNFRDEDFILRMNYLISDNPNSRKEQPRRNNKNNEYRIPPGKRIFDIVFALIALILLSPVFLIIAVLIKMESKGPVFYASRRVGTGYRIFNFYKFRSMTADADQQLKNIAHLNQYKKQPVKETSGFICPPSGNNEKSSLENLFYYPIESGMRLKNYISGQYSKIFEDAVAGICEECAKSEGGCKSVLFFDGNAVCEKMYIRQKKENDEGKFVKISNDPRVTRIGKFIRNTSLDELPQLFNVLKGDMSIVGNRPLPLYEAEKITTDQFTLRFLAPAGITGLWQVTKRGSAEMSEEERIQLDNDYAKNYSFTRDIQIIARTIPALLQKENV